MRSALALSMALSAAPAAAQGNVWIVDDDGGAGVHYTVLQDAVFAAADGDVVLVKQGAYGVCNLANRSLTICAEAGEDVQVGRILVTNTAADKTVRIQGLRSEGLTVESACFLSNNAGVVWIEDGVFQPATAGEYQHPGLEIRTSDAVLLANVESVGQGNPGGLPYWSAWPGPGLAVVDSVVGAFACRFEGGAGSTYCYDAGCTVSLSQAGEAGLSVSGDSVVHLSATTAIGGRGGPSLSVTTFGACSLGKGGFGLWASCGASLCPSITLQDSAILGGPGGPGFGGCPDGPDGDPIGGDAAPTVDSSLAMALTAPSPVRENTLLDVALDGPPLVPVLLGISFEPDSAVAPWLGAPLALAPPYLAVLLGSTSSSGALQVSLPLPALPPGIQSMVVHGQAAYVDPSGAAVLGGARMLVLLDDSF